MTPNTKNAEGSRKPKQAMASNEARISELPPQNAGPETKLSNEFRLRRFTEKVLDSRQDELEAREKENARLAKKLEFLQKELRETQSLLAQARSQSKTKSKELQEARDQIFRLQPQRKDITESEAQDGYRKLCGNVQRWVENRLGPILNDLEGGHLKSRPTPAHATRLISLIRDPARCFLNAWKSDEYHVVAIVMHYLWLVFFAKSFYCPLDDSEGDGTTAWIEELESAMSKLPRDVSHCREWRCETLTALTSQSEFKSRRSSYLNLITEDLASLLSIVVPKMSAAELQHSLRRGIIEPAADLAHRLQLAPTVFSLKWPARTAWSRLEVYECINLASDGLALDLSGTNASSQARRNVSYLFDVAPGLFVERVEAGKKATLRTVCRPTVLVYAGEDGNVPQSSTLTKLLWDHSNGQSRNSARKSKILISGRLQSSDLLA